MQNRPRKSASSSPLDVRNANVTSAIGLEETVGRRRAKRTSLFTQTMIWVTGLVCTAFLLGAMAQAWSNSLLMQKVHDAQVKLQQTENHNKDLAHLAKYYQDPTVIENEARQQLGYIRPGEHAVVIISSPDQGQTSSSSKKAAPTQQGFWQEWWNSLFGT